MRSSAGSPGAPRPAPTESLGETSRQKEEREAFLRSPDVTAFLSKVREGERDGSIPPGTAMRLYLDPARLRDAMSETAKRALETKIETTTTREVARAVEEAQAPGITIGGRRLRLKKPPDFLITIVTWVTVLTVTYQLGKFAFRLVRGKKAPRAAARKRRK